MGDITLLKTGYSNCLRTAFFGSNFFIVYCKEFSIT